MTTGIEWTDETWNPVTGCEYASPGCLHCYAADLAATRLRHVPAYAGLAIRPPGGPAKFTGELRWLPDRLEQPLRWRQPRRIFVNSMSDLFHPEVLKMTYEPTGLPVLAELFAVMVAAHRHTFQILTKRPKIMAMVLRHPNFKLDVNAALLRRGHTVMPGGMSEPETPWPRNIWCGTSIESDDYSWRADQLRQVPAAVRWISAEPLLGPLTNLELERIDWLVVGGESGRDARPMHPSWARDLRIRAADAGIPFLLKQWGEWTPDAMPEDRVVIELNEDGSQRDFLDGQGHRMAKVGKKAAGRELDGRTWDQYPQEVVPA